MGESKVCTECGGEGLIQVDDLTTKMCRCAWARAMRAKLGPEIAGAPSLPKGVVSPLFVQSETDTQDWTTKNLYLKGRWTDLLPHFKYAFIPRGLDFSFKFTTDEKLKTIWVGDESYKARARTKRDDVDTYNSLSDFIVDCNLLIIRLGYLGYRNRAMPGILKEALMQREVLRRPTWLIEDPQTGTFCEGHFSYSDELWGYIQSKFPVTINLNNFSSEDTPSPKYKPMTVVNPGNGMAVEEETPGEPAPEPVDEEAIVSDIDAGMGGGGQTKYKNKGKSRYKPKPMRASDDFDKGGSK